MYRLVMVGVDGSECSSMASQAALELASSSEAKLIGCHVYAAQMHRARFQDMEPGLPDRYQEEERLGYLRNTHEGIISGGMKLISDAYLTALEEEAGRRNIPYESVTPEGRNYVQLLNAARSEHADLIALGACGQGQVPEGKLGSLTERVLMHYQEGDVLIMRRPWMTKGPIIVGVDGSQQSYAALDRALHISKLTGSEVEAVAVYDPFFHVGVFQSISAVISEEGKQRFNFAAQEQLHDEIIDRGLETLYRQGLERGVLMGREQGVEVKSTVFAGKVYPQLHHYAELRRAQLIVVGRWGLHREEGYMLGSNTHNLARIATTNLLVVGQSDRSIDAPSIPHAEQSLTWTAEAESMMERVPLFARGVARKSIENKVREAGLSEVTAESVRAVAAMVGMDSKLGTRGSADSKVAEVVVLRKVKKLAPDFHRHILRSKILGQEVGVGDKLLVYEVVETHPEGRVKIGENTRVEFK